MRPLPPRSIRDCWEVPQTLCVDRVFFVERFATSEVVLTGSTTLVGPSPEPPEPMTMTFVGRRTLIRIEGGTTYQAVDDPQVRLVLARQGAGWGVTEGEPEAGWQLYQRRAPGGPVEPFGWGPPGEPPAILELVKVEQEQRTFR